jgi:hypothetical protein
MRLLIMEHGVTTKAKWPSRLARTCADLVKEQIRAIVNGSHRRAITLKSETLPDTRVWPRGQAREKSQIQ